MGLKDWFGKSSKDEVHNTKVLVCALGSKFGELIRVDADIYKRYYATSTNEFVALHELTDAIAQGWDVVHLFCDISADGVLLDSENQTITGTQLIQTCCSANVKLFWIGNDNKSEGYIKNFKPQGSPINLAMTLSRNGTALPVFLNQLLSQMSAGATMPAAWASLAPQSQNDPRHADLPGCIFSAGRGKVVPR